MTVLVNTWTPRERVNEPNRTGKAATSAFFPPVKGPCLTRTVPYHLRTGRYTLLTTDTLEYVFLLETMHGITFALSYSSSVEYSRKLAPHQWAAFMQSLLYVVFFCVGPGVASLVGGFVMQVRV